MVNVNNTDVRVSGLQQLREWDDTPSVPTSVRILFISSFFLWARDARFCFSIHLRSSRLCKSKRKKAKLSYLNVLQLARYKKNTLIIISLPFSFFFLLFIQVWKLSPWIKVVPEKQKPTRIFALLMTIHQSCLTGAGDFTSYYEKGKANKIPPWLRILLSAQQWGHHTKDISYTRYDLISVMRRQQ